jgi:multiple sugar transport system substrate-binding protein
MKRLTRRDFLRVAAAAGSGALLAACAPKTVIVETEKVVEKVVTQVVKETVKETVVVEGTPQIVEKEITRIVEKEVEVTPEPTPMGEPVTIKFFVGWGTGNAPEHMVMQELLAQTFNDQHPNITMEYVREPWTEGHPKWFTMIAAGTPPDGAFLVGIGGLNEAGIAPDYSPWLDHGPLIDRDAIALDDFYPASIQGATHPFLGFMMGLPQCLHNSFIAYNKTLFAEVGLPDLPHSWDDKSWTYDKLLEYATALTLDKNGKHPNESGFDPENIAQFGFSGREPDTTARSWGGEMQEGGRTFTVDDPKYIDAYQWLADLMWKEHVAATGPQETEFFAGMSPLLSGKVGMRWSNSWDMHSYRQITDFEWEVAPCPYGPVTNSARMCIDTIAITADSKHPNEAWEFSKFVTKPGNSERLAVDSTNGLPPRLSGQQLYVERAKTFYPTADAQVILDGLNYGSHIEAWVPPVEWRTVYFAELDALWLNEKTAAEVMTTSKPKVQALWDEYWAKYE